VHPATPTVLCTLHILSRLPYLLTPPKPTSQQMLQTLSLKTAKLGTVKVTMGCVARSPPQDTRNPLGSRLHRASDEQRRHWQHLATYTPPTPLMRLSAARPLMFSPNPCLLAMNFWR